MDGVNGDNDVAVHGLRVTVLLSAVPNQSSECEAENNKDRNKTFHKIGYVQKEQTPSISNSCLGNWGVGQGMHSSVSQSLQLRWS